MISIIFIDTDREGLIETSKNNVNSYCQLYYCKITSHALGSSSYKRIVYLIIILFLLKLACKLAI